MSDQPDIGCKIATADGIVIDDAPCRKCAYNLRGLASDGMCPECGAPVDVSINGDLLCFSDPQYLESLRRGIHLIFAGIVVSIVIGIATSLLFRTAGTAFLGSFVKLAGAIIMVIGSWMLTAPDPSWIGELRYGTIRRVIRACLIVGGADDVLQAGLAVAMTPSSAFVGMQVVSNLVGIVETVGQLALLVYLSRLAVRLPDDALALKAKKLVTPIAVCEGIVVLSALVMVSLGAVLGAALGPAIMAFGCIAIPSLIVLLVLSISYLILLGNFATAFRLQAERSRLLWAVAETNSR